MSNKFFEKVGGRPALEKINKIFYDKVYADPWLSLYFTQVSQEHIESQQTDFLQSSFGGKKVYCGRLPLGAHQHVFITEELYALRSSLLKESLEEYGLAEDLIDHWMNIDAAFKSVMIKKSVEDCKPRFKTDPIVNIPNPAMKKTG